ncbi:gamma interferon inducible lysosomal thiol reductase (GILT) domain-containing protein [Phthorimaea operculella]|nr:gamma interferon inducible lysosomal thiol reductase (GILT) domain-containing protein [Phthorimaea operculella]
MRRLHEHVTVQPLVLGASLDKHLGPAASSYCLCNCVKKLYYESKCPVSKYFVLQQLLPVMRRLHEHVTVQYVPFGNAMSKCPDSKYFVLQQLLPVMRRLHEHVTVQYVPFGNAMFTQLLVTAPRLYGESKCPDSKYFVLQQLLPVMRRLHEHVTVQYVPFGNAMQLLPVMRRLHEHVTVQYVPFGNAMRKCPDSKYFVLQQLLPVMRRLHEHVTVQYVPFGNAMSKCPDSKYFVLQQLLPVMRRLHEHVTVQYVPFGNAVSKCLDSKYFVLQQLLPVMRRLHEHVTVQYVPFGNAMSIDSGYGGFKCQHGDEECFGNIVQDCALDALNQRGASDLEKLDYVACEMDTYAATRGDLQCVVRAKVMPDAIQECLNSGRGTALQLNSEYLTKLVHPKFIPTVTINGVFDQRVQDSANKDLFGTLCAYLPNAPACARYFNSTALNAIMNRHPQQMYRYW